MLEKSMMMTWGPEKSPTLNLRPIGRICFTAIFPAREVLSFAVP